MSSQGPGDYDGNDAPFERPVARVEAEGEARHPIDESTSPESPEANDDGPSSIIDDSAQHHHNPEVATSIEAAAEKDNNEGLLKDLTQQERSSDRESKLTRPSASRVSEASHRNGNGSESLPQQQQRRRRSPRALRDATLAQSVDILKQGLRSAYISDTGSPRHKSSSTTGSLSITQPHEPKFHKLHSRPLPKSSEELEEELLQQLQSQPFKARPLPAFCRSPRESTQDEPNPAELSSSKPVFKARPVPLTTYTAPELPTTATKTSTRRVFLNSPDAKSSTCSIGDASLPSIYKFGGSRPPSKSPANRTPTGGKDNSSTSGVFRPPSSITFGSDDGNDHHHKSTVLLTRSRSDDSDIQPFQLQSVVRHDQYQKQLQEQRRLEDEEAKRRMQFKARPYHPKAPATTATTQIPTLTRRPSSTSHTDATPSPKQLSTKTRPPESNTSISGLNEDALSYTFKARPLPKNVYPSKSPTNKVEESTDPQILKPVCVPKEEHTTTTITECIVFRDAAEPLPRAKPDYGLKSILLAESVPTLQAVDYRNGSQNIGKTDGTSEFTTKNGSSRHSENEKPYVAAVELPLRVRNDPPVAVYTSDNFAQRPAAKTSQPQPNHRPAVPPSQMSWPRVLVLVGTIRLCNVLLLQSYFDPDEFWQTTEPAYCLVFRPEQGLNCPGYTWEWKRRSPEQQPPHPMSDITSWIEASLLGPVRSHASLLPTYCLYTLAKMWDLDTRWLVSRGPLVLSALLVALPVDVALWYAARHLSSRVGDHTPGDAANLCGWCIFGSLVSWFNGYSLGRTYSNSQEATLLAIAVALVSPELLSLSKNHPRNGRLRACVAFLLGGWSTAIRFTSLAAFVPMGLILARRSSTISGCLGYLVLPCAVFGLLGLGVATVVDQILYGFWTLPLLGNFHFNAVLNLSSLYGTHPWYWYLTTGIPAVTGLLFPLLLWSFMQVLRGQGSYGERNLGIIVSMYVFIMSLSLHKEFRFIHPILPLVCLLTGRSLQVLAKGRTGKARLWRKWAIVTILVVANLTPVLYLGLFHQSGSISVNRTIVRASQAVAAVQHGDASTQHDFTISYWLRCHSTPLHSHLHAPPLQFHTWTLDCSPNCRADVSILCESDQFEKDPWRFVQAALGCSIEGEDRTCTAAGANGAASTADSRSIVPDFVVTLSSHLSVLQPLLDDVGLKEVGRFPQQLTGLRLGTNVDLGELDERKGSIVRWYVLDGLVVELGLEEVVLLSRHHVPKSIPWYKNLHADDNFMKLPRIYRY